MHRVWSALERRTGHTVFYLDEEQILAYCPACRDGTIRVRFLRHPRPGMTVTSNDHPGCCSNGCPEAQIVEALFA